MIFDLIVGAAGGLGIGTAYLFWLWRATTALATEGGGLGAILGGAGLRLAAVLAGFAGLAVLAQQPGITLLGALVSFAGLRFGVLRYMRAQGGRHAHHP
jgi:hypothetical protein